MIDFFEQLLNDVENVNSLDLTNKDDLIKYHEIIDKLRKDPWMNMFGDVSPLLDKLSKAADEKYNEAHKNNTTTVDNFERPSSKLTTQQGLRIHELVQEYMDTMVKPYNDGVMNTEQLNNAYAGLYEFASWVLLR